MIDIEFEYFRTKNYIVTPINDVTLLKRRGSLYTVVYYDGGYWYYHDSNLSDDIKSSDLKSPSINRDTFNEWISRDNYMSKEEFKIFRRKYIINKLIQ